MSSINQILNNALMESTNENLEEGIGKEMWSNFKTNTGIGSKKSGVVRRSFKKGDNEYDANDIKHGSVSKAMKGVALGTAGLGAGGAIAYETEKNKDSKSSEAPKASEPATSANKSDPDKDTTPYVPPKKSYMNQAKDYWDNLPSNAKYGAGAAAALGAGLGAVALAKKLRNKKAAAKK